MIELKNLPDKPMSLYSRHRLQRYASILQACQFDLIHTKSECLAPADAPSRLSCEAQIHEMYCDNLFEWHAVSEEDIAAETTKDELLSKIEEYIQISWPAKLENLDLQYYQKLEKQLSYDKVCLLLDNSVIIPSSRGAKVLKILHLAQTLSVPKLWLQTRFGRLTSLQILKLFARTVQLKGVARGGATPPSPQGRISDAV